MIHKAHLEKEVIKNLKVIYDPEIPVNIYDLGLIYSIDIDDQGAVRIVMTLTSPNCPVAESLPQEVYEMLTPIEGVTKVDIQLTFEPAWDPENLSDEVKLALGML
ncbi:MAG: FeS assembly SUF system protein [Bacteroidetes bacterium]|nr:MAG: FeS assembly SUF system protein [Bacteroidota bacterium]PIE87953.1 MAG: FeS assembly SUF system protein [Bacteroidota bacterium]